MEQREYRLLLALLAVILALSGCSQMRDKFIRKPKEAEKKPHYYRVKSYDVHPSLELYTKRYIFWKNWHRDFMDLMAQPDQDIQAPANHKKKVVAIEQELSNLIDMRNMLVDEKGIELNEYIIQMTEIEQQIKKQKLLPGTQTRIRRKMELMGKEIKRDFSYNKIGDYIRSDFGADKDYEGDYTDQAVRGGAAGD